jgi:pimeloyl-[acyl-carrier protein] methyl ester esterase
MLPGWTMHSGIWGGVVDALATEFRVNLVDLPGHGLNRHIELSRDLSSVAALILSEVPPATWIGWSLGGLIAMQAALAQPQKVKKLVLVAATPSFSRRPGWEYGVGAVAQQAFTDGLENDFEETVNQFRLQTFGANYLRESLRRLGGTDFTQQLPANATMQAGLHLLYSNNLLPELPGCKTPTLFLGGSRDRTIRPDSYEQAAALMPDASACIIPGAGHALFISHEDRFLEVIRGFLRGEQAA